MSNKQDRVFKGSWGAAQKKIKLGEGGVVYMIAICVVLLLDKVMVSSGIYTLPFPSVHIIFGLL